MTDPAVSDLVFFVAGVLSILMGSALALDLGGVAGRWARRNAKAGPPPPRSLPLGSRTPRRPTPTTLRGARIQGVLSIVFGLFVIWVTQW